MPLKTNRRHFLNHTSRAALAAGVGLPMLSARRALAEQNPSDRPVIGCIGLGGMGTGDARAHARFGDIAAVCDVDLTHALRAKSDERIGAHNPDVYQDYRRILDRADIDVVSIVTPDHWHVKIAIEALQAGKHVFCQKPLTLTIDENQRIRHACRQFPQQVFFVGTQQRASRNHFLRAVNLVQKGLLGDITRITVGIDGSPSGGPFATRLPPNQLDWDAWLGQAPRVDYLQERCHGTFRWWYEYSGGKFTDWGAHHIDIASWAINEVGEGQGPVEVDGTDAKHPVPFVDGYPTAADQFNTSTDFSIKCRFATGVEMTVTSRADNGILFEGERGRMFVNRGKITGTPIDEKWDRDQFGPDDLARLYKQKPFEGHKDNFFRCLREGGLPVSDVYSHIQIMNTCHLCTIAARLGRKLQWDPKNEQLVGDEQATSFLARTPREGFEIPRT